MTAIDPQQALAEALEEVLETMFFAAVLGDAPAEAAAGGAAARLEFRGALAGSFTAAACPAAARGLAAAFLALDETEVPPDRAAEVLCELANMLCGSVLGRLAPDRIFELGHPEPAPAEEILGGPPGTVCAADIGGGTVAVRMAIAR